MSFDLVHLNGALVPRGEARISIEDRGFLLGDGLFETLRVYEGKPAHLDAHLARLREGAAAMRLALPADIDARVAATLRANGQPACMARITVTRGPGGRGASPRGAGPPTLLVSLSPVPYEEALYARGIHAVTVTVASATRGLKTTSYAANVLARIAADEAGADEAILAEGDHLLEATQANLFVVRGDELVTPPLGSLLPGVTRAAILGLASAAGLRPVEAPLRREDVLGADEAMLTASVLEVAALSRLDGLALRRGPVAAKLRGLYRASVEAR